MAHGLETLIVQVAAILDSAIDTPWVFKGDSVQTVRFSMFIP